MITVQYAVEPDIIAAPVRFSNLAQTVDTE